MVLASVSAVALLLVGVVAQTMPNTLEIYCCCCFVRTMPFISHKNNNRPAEGQAHILFFLYFHVDSLSAYLCVSHVMVVAVCTRP